MRREITASDGTTWSVQNRWYRRPRLRSIGDRGLDSLDGLTFFDFGGDDLPGIAAGIVLAIVIGVLIVVLLPFILFLLEIPIVLALVFVVRRLWIVEAIAGSGEKRAWKVRGWRRSRRAVDEVASELEVGLVAEPEDALEPG